MSENRAVPQLSGREREKSYRCKHIINALRHLRPGQHISTLTEEVEEYSHQTYQTVQTITNTLLLRRPLAAVQCWPQPIRLHQKTHIFLPSSSLCKSSSTSRCTTRLGVRPSCHHPSLSGLSNTSSTFSSYLNKHLQPAVRWGNMFNTISNNNPIPKVLGGLVKV